MYVNHIIYKTVHSAICVNNVHINSQQLLTRLGPSTRATQYLDRPHLRMRTPSPVPEKRPVLPTGFDCRSWRAMVGKMATSGEEKTQTQTMKLNYDTYYLYLVIIALLLVWSISGSGTDLGKYNGGHDKNFPLALLHEDYTEDNMFYSTLRLARLLDPRLVFELDQPIIRNQAGR